MQVPIHAWVLTLTYLLTYLLTTDHLLPPGKKSKKTITVALSALEGAACMNNTFCLVTVTLTLAHEDAQS